MMYYYSMKTRHILLFVGAVFFFLFFMQFSIRAFWSQENGRLIWHTGEVLSETDDATFTYIIRPKPTATPAVIAPTSPVPETPTPTREAAFDYYVLPSLTPTPDAGGASGCLPAGTKVRMPDMTEKNIEDVRAGEYVLSFDGIQNVKAKVLETSAPVRDHLYTLHFQDGSSLQLTEEHPVFTKEGWKSVNPGAT